VNHSELPPVPSARLWRRLGAIAYDLLIVVALLVIATIAAILTRGGSAISPESVWFQVLLLAIWWLYFAWSWAERGQTVGMRAWRLVLRSEDGKPVSWARASVRFVAAGLSAAVVGLGFFWCLLDRDHRAWHDRLSRTVLGAGLDRVSHSSQRARPEHGETRS
jgi:uncharacterized RDD family membrane protein YckC